MPHNLEVSGLYYHPIKSCAATSAEEITLTPLGVQYDREWIILDDTGTFVTQRTNPELAVVTPRVVNDGLIVDAPGMSTLNVEPGKYESDVTVDFFKKAGAGETQGAAAHKWFSDYLHKNVELLRVVEPRPIKPELLVNSGVEHIAFADAFPILLTSEASLADLNSNMDQPVPMNRFRPNIVVRGDDLEAYDEDYWRAVAIGDLKAFVVRACARCPVPDTEQSTGVRDIRPVTAALRKTRKGTDVVNDAKGVFFGQNLIHVFEEDLAVKVGDQIVVTERSAERNLILG